MEKREIQRYCVQPSLADFKAHVRVTSSDLDGVLEQHLLSAIRSAEHHIGQIIALSTFTFTGKFTREIELEDPVVRVLAVYVDGHLMADDTYDVTGHTLSFAHEVTGSSVSVTYEAGMEDVEFDIRAAVLLQAARLFNNPADTVETLPTKSSILLRPYRRWGGRK